MQLEAHALKLMAACFNDMKHEESFVRRTRKLSMRFLCQFEQQPEGKALFKSKFSYELGEINKISSNQCKRWLPTLEVGCEP